MTTLVGTVSDSYAVILSESQISDDSSYLRMPSDNLKVVRNGDWVIAGSGWSRPHDLVQYLMKWQRAPITTVRQGHQAIAIWIIRNIVPKIIQTLEKNKAIDFDKGTAQLSECEFLIAGYGYLFILDEGFGVTPIEDYFVSGSGGNIALGAIAVQKDLLPNCWQKDHQDINRRGIEQAIKFDLYSSGVIRGYRSCRSGAVEAVEFREKKESK